jgi:galactose mutarotase-like enzyme
MTIVELKNEHGSAVITPGAGASLRSLRANIGGVSHELLSGGLKESFSESSLPSGTGSFIMAPWVNRIHRGVLLTEHGDYQLPVNSGAHAIHGTVRRRTWELVSASETAATMQTTLEQPWPFRGSVIYRVGLNGPALVQVLEVHAAPGERRFPAGVGWHPWFRRSLGTGELSVRADVTAQWEMDENAVPSGKQIDTDAVQKLRDGATFAVGEVDDCFQFGAKGTAEIRWPELTLLMSGSSEVSQVMVYSPADSVCVEPQTTAVNAFQMEARGVQDNGTRFVTPRNPLIATTTWSWSRP